MLALASHGLLSFSGLPLRLPFYLGCGALVATIVATACSLAATLTQSPAAVWIVSPTALGLFFLGCVQLICLGIVGEYLNRIYDEVRARPRWIVDTEIGAGAEVAQSHHKAA